MNRRDCALIAIASAAVGLAAAGCQRTDGQSSTGSNRDTAASHRVESQLPPVETRSDALSQTEPPLQPVSVGEAPSAAHADLPTTAAVADSEWVSMPFDAAPPADGPALRDEAAQFFKALVERVPGNPDALEVKARFHLLVGESAEAKECWEQALKLAPDYAYAYHGLGKVAMLNADVELAIEYFEKAIQGLPGNLDPVHDLADAYLKLGKIDQATELLRSATHEHPRSTATWVQLGQASLANREFNQAREAFEQALKLAPNLPRAQQGLGTALMRLGDRDRAKELLEAQRAHRIVGKNRSTDETFADERSEVAKRYVYAARVYFAHGDNSLAEYALRRATVFQPDEEAAWELLLSYYQTAKRQTDVIAVAEEMCRVRPENPSYHYTLGVLSQQSGEVDKARQEFHEVIRLAPRSVEGYQALAQALIGARQELGQCVEIAQKCVELRGAARDFELLAQAQAVNGQLNEAHQTLSKAIELDPSNQAYQQAMQQLKRAIGAANE